MTERRLPGLLSRELHGGERLMVTWVEVAPGAAQRPHAHERSEQVYVIVRGSGVAVVAGEERTVGEGDVVAIPPQTEHWIRCAGEDPLVYVSATAPPEDMSRFY